MTTVTTVTAAAPARTGPPGERAAPRTDRSFLRWGLASYGLVLAVVLVACLRASGGHLVYALDDPAIHLSLADDLVHHGTWGVDPGEFQSASSSPLWTLLVAATMVLWPSADALGPLALNVAAAVAVIAILGANQTVLRPGRRHPLDVAAVAVVVVVVLFLPGLTVVGMEHTLHMALVLAAVVLFHRRGEGGLHGGREWPAWLPYALLALATFVRVETAFVAAGVAVALVARCVPGWGREPVRPALRRAGLALLAAIVPLGLMAASTRLAGQGLLPSSILAKAQTDDQALHYGFLRAALNRLTTDPLVACLVLLALGALVLAWRQRRRYVFPAIVVVVAAGLHSGFARVGWYERYQAYLVLLGTYAALQIAGDALSAERRRARPALVPVLVLAALALTATKVSLTTDAPRAVQDTYEQRYQAARFLARYYDGQPVATGELGYVSLFHDGPTTDLLGLGDYEVLRERRATHQHPPPDYWADLARRRGFDVVAVYPSTLGDQTPGSWRLAGEWTLDRRIVTAWEPTFQFWATTPEALAPLQDHLRDFAASLPPGVTVRIP